MPIKSLILNIPIVTHYTGKIVGESKELFLFGN